MRAVLAMTAAVMSLCLTAGTVQAAAPPASHWRVLAAGPEVAEPGEWTYIAGVYNAETRDTYLYVSGNVVGGGVTNTQWSGTGGFTVGAAHKAGVTTAFFPGSVDEVKFYGGAFTHEEGFQRY